jgi:hypothetical protein
VCREEDDRRNKAMVEACAGKQTEADEPFILETGVAQITITSQRAKEKLREVGGVSRLINVPNVT